MQKILFELYHGNICPAEGRFPKEEEYRKSAEQVCSIEESLLSQLDEIGKELYKQLSLATIVRDTIEDAHIFADAFRLGANIMMACLVEGEDD